MKVSMKKKRLTVLERQEQRLENRLKIFQEYDNRFAWMRMAILLLGGIGTYLALQFGSGIWGEAVGILSIGTFGLVVAKHRQLDKNNQLFKISLSLIKTMIARMELNWRDIPHPLSVPQEKQHPFEVDLNVTSDRSIHRLIDTSNSTGGSQRLRSWLLDTRPELEKILYRQSVVKELEIMYGFRTKLALAGALAVDQPGERWDGEGLMKWLEKDSDRRSILIWVILLGCLGLVNLALFIMNALGWLPAFWSITLLVYGVLYFSKHQQYRDLFDEAYYLGSTLEKFREVLLYLEDYPYNGVSQLAKLCEPFIVKHGTPSRYLRRIVWIASATSLSHNPLLGLMVNLVVPWDLYFSERLERYKLDLRGVLPKWLETWYDLEALISLANFSYLNPDFNFPEVVESINKAEHPFFEGRHLGHPLLDDDKRICNDFTIDQLGEITIVSGSNMSGKSTFLRTLGVNLVLAYAGGRVNAHYLRVVPMRVFSSMGISDSLSDGISFFYAEVKRLKTLLEELELENPLPLFFLIDEIFQGTNNREREIGSRSYVGTLAGKNGIGVISTHDLELVKLADEINQVNNYHFREEVYGGKMVFDYHLRQGPCPTTNALKIMQMEGLPIEIVRT
jgi:hypothetical protein